MSYKRFAIELGMGVDLHGEDYTKASIRAVKDAISRVCLVGLIEALNLGLDEILVEIILGVPKGGEVVKEEVARAVPIGRVEVRVVEGGLRVPGVCVPAFGCSSDIIVVNACVVVNVPGRPGLKGGKGLG